MKIKKGQCFLCVKDYVMNSGLTAYNSGNKYFSEIDGCITDENGIIYHDMSEEIDFNEHFELIDL